MRSLIFTEEVNKHEFCNGSGCETGLEKSPRMIIIVRALVSRNSEKTGMEVVQKSCEFTSEKYYFPLDSKLFKLIKR